MSRWAEAWTQPETGTFERTIAYIPWARVGGSRSLSKIGGGSIEIPASYGRLDDIIDPDNNTGSLIRLFEDSVNVGSFYAQEVEFNEEEQGTVTINGEGIESALEFGTVYPWDWSAGATVTKFPDWVYGLGTNEIADPGFEENPYAPLINGDGENGDTSGWSTFSKHPSDPDIDEIVTTNTIINNPSNAYEGDYFFKVEPGGYHSGIMQSGLKVYPGKQNQFQIKLKEPGALGRRFTAGATITKGGFGNAANQFYYDGTIMAELDNVASTGDGTPGGSSDGTWQTIDLDIVWGDTQTEADLFIQFDHHKLTDGPEFWVDAVTMSGFGVGTGSWEPDGIDHITVFEGTDSIAAHDGDYSLKLVTDGAHALGGVAVRQEVSWEEGAPYYYEVWVKTLTVGTPTIRIYASQKDGFGTIASVAEDLVYDTWTKIALEFDPPEGIHFGWISIAVDETYATEIYIDDTVMRTGLAPHTAGYIVHEHLDLITTRDGSDSALTWLYYDSFDEYTDSNGVSWPEEMAIRIPRGQSMRQLLDQLAEWGYEWEIVWYGPALKYELRLYVPYDGSSGGAGGSSDVNLISGKSFRKGLVRLRDAGPNTFLAEGLEGALHEKADATMAAGYGRREGYLPQPRTEESDSLESMIDAAIVASKNQKYGVKASLFERPFPETDFDLGDRIGVDLPPHLPNDTYRVVGWTTVWTAEDESSYTLDFSTNVFDQPFGGTTSTATSYGLNYLLGKFEGLPDVDRLRLDITADGQDPKESVPTLMVTAYDSREEVINHGDIECGGAGDQEPIQVGADEIEVYGQGRLILAEGHFLIDSAAELDFAANIKVTGLGMYVTSIVYPSYGTPPAITGGQYSEFSDFAIVEEEPEGC